MNRHDIFEHLLKEWASINKEWIIIDKRLYDWCVSMLFLASGSSWLCDDYEDLARKLKEENKLLRSKKFLKNLSQ